MRTSNATASRYPFWQVLVAIVIGPVGVGIVVNLVASLIVAFAIVAREGGSISVPALTDATQTLPVIVTSMLITALGFAGTPITLAAITRRPILETTGLSTRPHPLVYLLAPIGILALQPTSDALVELARRVAPDFTFDALAQIEEIASRHSIWVLIPLLAVCPGFGEEMLFRGFIQRWLGKGAFAVAVSGLSFAAIHLDPHHVIGVVPLGLYLAWVADRTDSTRTTIAAHTVNNAAAVFALKLGGGATPADHATLPVIVGGWIVCAASLLAIARLSRRRPGRSEGETLVDVFR